MENHAGLVFSPDGNTAYWYAWNGVWGGDATSPRTIYFSVRRGVSWTRPAKIPFTDGYQDADPYVSPDGRWLYFTSERPSGPGDQNLDADIWRYSLVGENLLERLAINSEATEYSPIITASGALYFASDRPGGHGRGDLYRSAEIDGSFGPPQLLGPELNSPTGEWNLWVSSDETEILFEASSRPGNVSIPGDLYYSWWTGNAWMPAVPIRSLNTAGSDLMPRLDPNDEILYYTSAPIGGNARILSVAWRPLRDSLVARY